MRATRLSHYRARRRAARGQCAHRWRYQSTRHAAPGSAPGSVLWHGVELDNLSDLIESVAVNAQVIPLFASKNMKEGAELRGAVAAQNNLPSKAKVVEHQYVLAFALTDFK